MAKKPAHRKRVLKERKEYEEEVLQIDRVTRVVKGGRRLAFRATVIIGNRRGKVAIGIGKATEVISAIQKAVSKAKKNIVRVPMDKGTIPHDIKVKFKATKLLLIPASTGTGIKAGSSTRKILELAGVKDILAKRMGSGNRINLAKATIKALTELGLTPGVTLPEDKPARKRPQRSNNRNRNNNRRNNNTSKPAPKKLVKTEETAKNDVKNPAKEKSETVETPVSDKQE